MHLSDAIKRWHHCVNYQCSVACRCCNWRDVFTAKADWLVQHCHVNQTYSIFKLKSLMGDFQMRLLSFDLWGFMSWLGKYTDCPTRAPNPLIGVKTSCLTVRSYIISRYRCLSLSRSPSHGPLFLTAGGHSSNLSLWQAVNLPRRDLHSHVCQEPFAREGRAAKNYLFISSQPHIFSLRPDRTTTS